MKVLTTFFTVLALNAFAQTRIGIINDADGYTNVREEKNTSAKILTKFYDYEAFEFTSDSSIWYKVNLSNGRFGYIHQSRVHEVKECTCKSWSGVPKFIVENDKHVVEVCGYVAAEESDKVIKISEARIANCLTNETLLEIDATETAVLKIENNELQITKVGRLPVGKNWSFIETPINTYTIDLKTEKIKLTKKSALIPPFVTPDESNALVDGIKKNPPKNAGEFEKAMYKLFVAAISGDVNAESIFRNYKKEFGVTLDGSVAEDFSNLKSILEEYKNSANSK